LIRAHQRAAEFIEHPQNRAEAAAILAQRAHRVDADVIQRTLKWRLKISPDGTMRESSRYLLVGREGAARPIRCRRSGSTAAWCAGDRPRSARRRFNRGQGRVQAGPHDAALGREGRPADASDAVGAFDGPASMPRHCRANFGGLKIGRPEALTKPMEQCWASHPTGPIFRLAARNWRR